MNETSHQALAIQADGGNQPRITVLLVDDHAMVRQGLAAFLQTDPGLEVTALGVAGGHAALETARRLRPDVIIMDVRMNGLSGVEATRRILAELPQTRVIGLSMDASNEAAMRAAGCVDFLLKTSPVADVVAAIHRHAKSVPT